MQLRNHGPDGVFSPSMTKRLSILTALLVLATMGLASTAQAKPAIGLADQSVDTLKDPRFQKSGLKRARIAVPYDGVRRGGRIRQRLDEYFELADEQNLDVIVSFYRTESLKPKRAARLLPSVSGFRSDFRRFRQRYPQIKKFSTWNEMNFPLAQPTGRNPKRTGQFYKMLRKECRGGKCSVLTGDFRANGSAFDRKWLAAFLKEIGPGPHQWGLIAYPDVNKFQTKFTRAFLKSTRRGNVHVTEVGPINVFGRFYKKNLGRQNRAMKYTMVNFPRVSSRIKSMYIYHWRESGNSKAFDSGLIDKNGKPRPAYFTFFKYLKRKAPTS